MRTGEYIYLIKRIGYMAITVWLITVLIFTLTQVLPGSAANVVLGPFATEESVAALESELGLNRPIYIQYIDWVSGIVAGDFGTSFVNDQPVVEIVMPAFFRSLQLMLLSILIVSVVAIPLGVIAATRKGGPIDLLTSGIAYIGVSMPEFVTSILLLFLFSGPILLSVLPNGGYVPLSEGLAEWGRHMILPTIALTVILTAHVMRQTRSEMIEVLQAEYIKTARLKGIKEGTVIYRHCLKNALLPTITVIALEMGYVLGGIVVVEEVFSYPGLGRVIIQSIENRNIPVVQAGVLIIAITYTVANFGADIVYTYLDPRISYGGGGK
jgi:peptide/nickel transport system permease protein